MQEVNLISGIAVIALYIALIALVIYLIVAIKRITRAFDNITAAVDNINGAVDKIEAKIDHLTTKTDPLIDNAFVISNDIKEISGNFKLQAAKINGIVDSVKDTTDSIIDFEQKVQKEAETHVFDTINMVASVTKGVKTFLGVLTGSKNGSHHKIRSKSSFDSEEDLY